jgi:hypothetical protein
MSGGTKPTGLAALREAFGPEHVGLLPKISCGACSKAREKHCDKHSKKQCQTCGNWITERHIHLDYVGHGAVTDRLLDVDPEWTWEPLATDHAGMPTMVYDDKSQPIALWIKLTICGVTRLGVGTCPGGQFEAEKVLIGDALRNAAMRFGVALDLWIKGQAEDSEQQSASDTRSGPNRARPEPTVSAKDMIPAKEAKDRLVEAASGDMDAAAAAWNSAELGQARQVTPDQMAKALAKLEDPADTVREAFSEAIADREPGQQQSLVEAGQ